MNLSYQRIEEQLSLLQTLCRRDTVFLEDIPGPFKNDIQHFIAGETLTLQDGKIRIGINLFKKWYQKVQVAGFDYEIDWNDNR